MKLTKEQLREMIREAVLAQLSEGNAEKRVRQLDRLKMEASLSYMEILEDVVEQLDDSTWKSVLEGLRKKYGYRL